MLKLYFIALFVFGAVAVNVNKVHRFVRSPGANNTGPPSHGCRSIGDYKQFSRPVGNMEFKLCYDALLGLNEARELCRNLFKDGVLPKWDSKEEMEMASRELRNWGFGCYWIDGVVSASCENCGCTKTELKQMEDGGSQYVKEGSDCSEECHVVCGYKI